MSIGAERSASNFQSSTSHTWSYFTTLILSLFSFLTQSLLSSLLVFSYYFYYSVVTSLLRGDIPIIFVLIPYSACTISFSFYCLTVSPVFLYYFMVGFLLFSTIFPLSQIFSMASLFSTAVMAQKD